MASKESGDGSEEEVIGLGGKDAGRSFCRIADEVTDGLFGVKVVAGEGAAESVDGGFLRSPIGRNGFALFAQAGELVAEGAFADQTRIDQLAQLGADLGDVHPGLDCKVVRRRVALSGLLVVGVGQLVENKAGGRVRPVGAGYVSQGMGRHSFNPVSGTILGVQRLRLDASLRQP